MGTYRTDLSRRSFLLTVAGGAMAAPLLASCSSSTKKTSGASGAAGPATLAAILPAYVPSTLVTPDIPSVNGSDPAYLKYPTNPVKTVTAVPGRGGRYTAITPLWGAIPPASGNHYYDAMNQALGATLSVKPANGNSYNQVLPTLFTGDKLPDWIDIPGWNTNVLDFGKAVEAKFVDLTPYLSGENVKKYPNLANVPSNAWQAGVWNGKLFGIPCYPSNIVVAGAIYYRKDIFAARGLSEPTSADELFALGAELTDAKAKRWAFDDLWTYLGQPFDIPNKWAIDSTGKLIHKYETPEFLAAADFARKLASAGYVHPDAIAGNTNDAKQRFQSGQVAVYGDGTGAWGGMVVAQAQAGDKTFQMQAMSPFAAEAGKTPRVALGNGAGMFSYLNKKLSKDKIEELLAIADYLAAPFGSLEYTLINYGPDADHTVTASGPQLNPTGQKEVATTFQFLATCPSVTVQPGYPDWVRAYATWQADAAGKAYKPVFYDMNITEPAQYSSIGQQVEDTILDVVHGRKPVSALQSSVAQWRRSGGDALRDFYEQVRQQYGTGQ